MNKTGKYIPVLVELNSYKMREKVETENKYTECEVSAMEEDKAWKKVVRECRWVGRGTSPRG